MEILTTETFRTKVFDVTSGTDFKFTGSKPVIIDFYADWCGPCKTIAPMLEELSQEYPGIDFYKVDTEESVELAAAFGIRNIPSVLFIPLDNEPKMSVGAKPKKEFEKKISEWFNM